jgi:GINS complex protein
MISRHNLMATWLTLNVVASSSFCVFFSKESSRKLAHRSKVAMNPAEVEFLAENQTIQIIPNFSHERLYLICGEVGPFRPGIPVNVPLWMAINLKQRQKCRLTAPEWMTIETLSKLKEDESQSRNFIEMPDEHYYVTTELILSTAPHDIPNADEIRTLVKVSVCKLKCIYHHYYVMLHNPLYFLGSVGHENCQTEIVC